MFTEALAGQSGLAFIGSYVLGLGFTLPESEARALIHADTRYEHVLFPYLNGKDVNNHPKHGTARWVINFHDWSQERAEQYPKAYEQVLREAKPERDANKRKVYRDNWWQYAEKRLGMGNALASLNQCIVMAQVSKVVMPVIVPTGQVFDQKLVVFASGDPALLAFLSSSTHYWWAVDRSATMKADLSYSPSDAFVTLVRPRLTDRLRSIGAHLEGYRRDLMLSRGMGLTATYNLVHDPECQDKDIVGLRRIHEEIDKATIEAYSWYDLLDCSGDTSPIDRTHESFPLDHGFHETDQGIRYTIGPFARTEITDRLRQLNHQAYADEVHVGLHKETEKKAREKHPDLPAPSAEAMRKRKEKLTARGGSDFGEGAEGSLF